MKIFIYLFNYLFIAAFIASAAVQYNDPDPYVWISIYLMAAGSSFSFAIGRLPWTVAAVTGGLAMVWLMSLVPQAMEATQKETWGLIFSGGDTLNKYAAQSVKESVEMVREVGGLSIVLLWMTTLSLVAPRRSFSQDIN